MRIETELAQAGSRWDERTGAVSMPVYQAATFRHPGLGQSTGFDYSRTSNPTRLVLEETMARLDGGHRAFAFASGLAAIDCVMRLFKRGDCVVATEDLYGGSFRLFEKVYQDHGIEIVYVDTSRADRALAVLDSTVRGIFLEVPTNPLLKIADVKAIAGEAKKRGILTIVDNTFLTPCLMKPLKLGADLAIYSATKYLGGHNDVLGGIVVSGAPELSEKIAFLQNAVGAVLGPQDSWLLLRGLKTLSVRMERQQKNAAVLAGWLSGHPRVRKVHYPGLLWHRGRLCLRRQASGFGAMISIEVADPSMVPGILAGVRVFLFAESLGGVESLITFPAVQTHADMAPEIRKRLGIHDRLLRLSAGIENVEDLIEDLDAALSQ
ncbi:MAG TPA: PLP-dependent aspartate aminotransferase family protein [Rectinemataceae bacterium]|nr:PLP-dependent aspartate aminotransferase family protein [Rectinemataceae bacterium]